MHREDRTGVARAWVIQILSLYRLGRLAWFLCRFDPMNFRTLPLYSQKRYRPGFIERPNSWLSGPLDPILKGLRDGCRGKTGLCPVDTVVLVTNSSLVD